MNDKIKLLKILEENPRLTVAQLAQMAGIDLGDAEKTIAECEQNHTILGYRTMIDWNKTDVDTVTAFIEVKLQPQRGDGFDRIASHIYRWPEVTSVHLMSGGFDLAVTIQGKSLNEVAMFVAQKLAPMEGVTATATHFVLKKYKDHGVEFVSADDTDHRNVIV
ncbi:MAG: Lrp/AsnC family transcriptional regulator [Clostridia bacterium]|nr:Lrp/AsnC family transcriptional regulator [Clostridia bacterium]